MNFSSAFPLVLSSEIRLGDRFKEINLSYYSLDSRRFHPRKSVPPRDHFLINLEHTQIKAITVIRFANCTELNEMSHWAECSQCLRLLDGFLQGQSSTASFQDLWLPWNLTVQSLLCKIKFNLILNVLLLTVFLHKLLHIFP